MTRRGSEIQGVAEHELDDLFAPRRVDAEAFRRGIAERIERAEREAAALDGDRSGDVPSRTTKTQLERRTPDQPAHASFWRKVAAFLPFDPTASGAVTGAAAAKAFGGKVLPAALVLPGLVLTAVFGGFFASLRALPRVSEKSLQRVGHDPRQRPRSSQASGWTQLGPFVFLALLFSPWSAWAADALTLALVASMLALAPTARHLQGSSVFDRRDMALSVCVHVYTMLSFCFLEVASLPVTLPSSEVGLCVSFFALLGVLWWATVVYRQRRVSRAAVVGWVVVVLVLNPMGITFSTPSVLRSKLAAMNLDPMELRGWDEAAALHRALVAIGSRAPEPEGACERLRAVLRSEHALDVHPTVWTGALDMGLLEADDWRELGAREGSEPLPPFEGNPFIKLGLTDYNRYSVAVSLALGRISDARRDYLAECLLHSWPSTGDHGALGDALQIVRVVDMYGRGDRLPALREEAHTLLRDHWMSPVRTELMGTSGGFSPDPEQFQTSMVSDTLNAVELMAYFGVPEGIDVTRLRGYLRSESRAMLFLVYEPMPYLRAEARAALLRLERELELPPVGVLERVLGERFAIAALLLAVLAVCALRSPRPLGPGALP